MEPVDIRLWGIPGVALLWVLALAAFGLFGWRVGRFIRLLRRGRPENRFDRWGARAGHFLRHVLLQPRIFNERSIGLPHFLIFWGFVVYATCFMWGLFAGLLPFLALPVPEAIPVAVLFLDLFAVVVLAALAVAWVRRRFFPPAHLHISGDAYFILGLIGLLMLSTLFGAGFRAAHGDVVAQSWAPAGRWVGRAFAGWAPGTLEGAGHAMWWLHVGAVLFFLAYLPYSKHLHLLAAPFNVFFSNPDAARNLETRGGAEETGAGASRWEDLTWKQLLSGFSCAECGRCDRACPATASGYPLQPQQLIQKLKHHLVETGWKDGPGGNGAGRPKFNGDVIGEDEIWACLTCMACMERCAVWNEQIPLIVALRRHLVGEGRVDRAVQDVLSHLTRYGNSFGKSDRMRARWVQNAGLKIKDARKEPVQYLWFVGDYASFDPRVEEITKLVARLLERAGVDFGLLYEGERNSGNDARRLGEEGLFEVLRDKNLRVLEKARFEAILTTDPHTYNALKNEYPWNGRPVRVRHYTELLDELIASGRLQVQRSLARRVVYHDACYLGRYNGIYEPPRRVLRALGLDLVELPRNRDRSYCCGAGGGRIWMEDSPGLKIKERPAENRVREAAQLAGVGTLVVACPKDLAMFRDAVKTTGLEDRLEVRDVAELVWEAVP